MQYTISLHRGGEKDYVREHNNRLRDLGELEAHIDRTRNHETWKDVGPREAYDELFSEAVAQRNRQIQENKSLSAANKKSRTIKDYYDAVKNDSRKNAVYEMIVSIGSKNERPSDEICRDILKKYSDGWEERNPNMKLIGSYYHEDELGAPHLHVDYIPVGHYENGQRVRNCQTKALDEMGYKQKTKEEHGEFVRPLTQWQRDERQHLTELMLEKGLGVKKLKSKTAHKTIEEFKAMKIEESLERATAKDGEMLKKLKNIKAGDAIVVAGPKDAEIVREMCNTVETIKKNKSAFNKFLVDRALEKENAVAKVVADKIGERVVKANEFISDANKRVEVADKREAEVIAYAKGEAQGLIGHVMGEAKQELNRFAETYALGKALEEYIQDHDVPIELEAAVRTNAHKYEEDVKHIWSDYIKVDDSMDVQLERNMEKFITRERDDEMEL